MVYSFSSSIHLDLKPANFILINGWIKLIDFGLSLTVPQPPSLEILRETTCGMLKVFQYFV